LSALKNKPTKAHIIAINQTVRFYGSQTALADFLGIAQPNIAAWVRGAHTIPLWHAETLSRDKNLGLGILDLRPDIKKYEKYFK